MARLVLEDSNTSLDIPITEAEPGYYVVTYDKSTHWIGSVIAIRGKCVVRLTDAGVAEAPPSFPQRECFDSSGTRVRPLRPGEKLVCVE